MPTDTSQTEQMVPPLYTRRDVATLLACCTETVKRLERRGALPAIKINSRVTRYEQAAVEKMIAEARVQKPFRGEGT
jgi:hypothetical protein